MDLDLVVLSVVLFGLGGASAYLPPRRQMNVEMAQKRARVQGQGYVSIIFPIALFAALTIATVCSASFLRGYLQVLVLSLLVLLGQLTLSIVQIYYPGSKE